MKKRILSMVLILIMILGMAPISALAAQTEKPRLEWIETTSYDWDKNFSANITEYNLKAKSSNVGKVSIVGDVKYNREKYTAVVEYNDSEGASCLIDLSERSVNGSTTDDNGKMTHVYAQIDYVPFENSEFTITVADRKNAADKTVYTFHVTRPRSEQTKMSRVILKPQGGNCRNTLYNGYKEGSVLIADAKGNLADGENIEDLFLSKSDYYKLYALKDVSSFDLGIYRYSHTHALYSIDDGKTWHELNEQELIKGLTFPESGIVKVLVRSVSDKDYTDAVRAGKDGFSPENIHLYTFWIERASVGQDSAQLLTAETETKSVRLKDNVYKYDAMVPKDAEKATFTYTITENSTAYLRTKEAKNGEAEVYEKQTPDANEVYTLELTGKETLLRVENKKAGITNTYTLKKSESDGNSDRPDSIADFLSVNSQYTNISNDLNNPELTLNGSMVSLGGFGGYITYYYENGIKDDPNNKYGVDFYVYGNALIQTGGGTSFLEPGQVYVSEDGEKWYTVAGAAHYDDNVLWDYSITYSKASGDSSKAAWVDSLGNSNDGSKNGGKFPTAINYPLNELVKQDKITLSGVLLPSYKSQQVVIGESQDCYPVGWGYVDAWANCNLGDSVNPYLANENYLVASGGAFDLAWTVDEQGKSVDVSDKEFHYIKIQTASNVWHEVFNDKSTEVTGMNRATPAEKPVGKTAAPAAISIDGNTLNLKTGVYSYNTNVKGGFLVEVDVPENTNVYINNTRTNKLAFDKMPQHKTVRVLVQEGEKEPAIYYINLTDGGASADARSLTLKANGGYFNPDEYMTEAYFETAKKYDITEKTLVFDEGMKGAKLETVRKTDKVRSVGWSYNGKVYTEYTDGIPDGAVLTAAWGDDDVKAENIKVTLRLIGSTKASADIDLASGGYNGAEYQTWLPTETYTVSEGSSVLSLLEKAMTKAGIKWVNADGNYISSITAPAALGGHMLEEMANGPRSGWMFTVNGKHGELGIAQQKLADGDEIVFHYVNDYSYEIADWSELDGESASQTKAYHNRWLFAADSVPDGAATATAGSGSAYTVQKGDTMATIALNNYGVMYVHNALYRANIAAFKATGGKLNAGMTLALPAALGSTQLIGMPKAGEGETLYVIKSGDTLAGIAYSAYGDAKMAEAIFTRNQDRLRSINEGYVGQIIVLPAK